jgi:aspartate/methionine/tyrosine aminotransferase
MPKAPATVPALDEIQLSVYSALAARAARAATEGGGEVFPFHVGDTWMEPAEGCRMENLTVAEYPGLHRYTPPQGWPPLIDAVVERVRAAHGIPTERDQVLVTGGATLGLGAVVGSLVEPGEEVLITAPYWPLIAGIVRTFHGVPVAVPFFDPGAGVDSIDGALAALDAARTVRTVAVYWNTPNNPSGRTLPADWLAAMAEWARRNGLWILADEVYEECVYDGAHAPTRPLAPERVFSCHSFSKAYGMAGNRAGFVVGPRDAMDAVRKIGTHTVYSTPTAAQVAAARALAGPGLRWAAEARGLYREIGDWTADRLGVTRPQGAAFLFLDLAEHLGDGDLGGFLARAADRGVLLAPGPSFGPYPRHARLCFTATAPDVTRRGVEALAGLLGR